MNFVIDQEVVEKIYIGSYKERYDYDEFNLKLTEGLEALQSKHNIKSTTAISYFEVGRLEAERIALEYNQECLIKHLLSPNDFQS